MIRLSELVGQRAVALGTAANNGTVKAVVIQGDRIVGVELSDIVIPAGSVRSFEGDVLTYDEQRGTYLGGGNAIDPRGTTVLDMSGDSHGRISDLLIDAAGTIEAVVLDTGDSVPGQRLRAIGTFAAVLGDEQLPPPTGPPVA